MYTVYLHVNKINNKKYFGQTCQTLTDRWAQGSTYRNSKHLYRAIQKYGWESFNHFIIADKLTKEEADLLEIKLIQAYDTIKSGYNICHGGAGVMMGRKHSLETKQKIRERRKNQVFSKESQKIKAETILGFKYQYIKVTFHDGNIRKYQLVSEIAEELGFDKGHVNRCLNGKRKSHNKCTFTYCLHQTQTLNNML